jgi:hypothetical protein
MTKTTHSSLITPTVVGLPSRDEVATVAGVARAADAGLLAAVPHGRNQIVLADNGSTDGTVSAFVAEHTATRQRVLQAGGVGTGKGTNVFALIEHTLAEQAGRLVLLDTDLRSAQPEWIRRMVAGLGTDPAEPVLVVPTYLRDRYEAGTTSHLARPLVNALFGRQIQQPIGGEFALNAALMDRVADWPRPGSAWLYGIDIWLVTHALREGILVVEVELGAKRHSTPFPNVLTIPLQVLDSLFHVVTTLDRPMSPSEYDVMLTTVANSADRQDPGQVATVAAKVRTYMDDHRAEIERIFPTTRDFTSAPWGVWISTEAWPTILADAVAELARGQFEVARDHLVALYLNRLMTWWNEVGELSSAEVDALLDQQARDTAKVVTERGLTFATAGPGEFTRGHWTGIS